MGHMMSGLTRGMGRHILYWIGVALLGSVLTTDGHAQRGGGRRGGGEGGGEGGGPRMRAPMIGVLKAREGRTLTVTLPNGNERAIELPNNTRVARMEPLDLKKLKEDDNINVSGPTAREGGFKVQAMRIELLPERSNVGPQEEAENRRILDQAERPQEGRTQTVGLIISTNPLKIKTGRERIYTVETSADTKVFKTSDSSLGDLTPGQRLRLVTVPGEQGGELRGVSITVMPNED